jgi:hypothetical protein
LAASNYALNWAVVAMLPLTPSLITPLQQQQQQERGATPVSKKRTEMQQLLRLLLCPALAEWRSCQ